MNRGFSVFRRFAASIVSLLVLFSAPGVAGATGQTCQGVARPSDAFAWVRGEQSIELLFDLDLADIDAVEATRSFVSGLIGEFPSEAADATHAYLDSLVAWYERLAAACAAPSVYEGPYENKPAGPAAPFGFGGADIGSESPLAVRVIDGSSETVEVAVVDDDGAGLAKSGSESYVLAYFGAGLIAFGAAALGARRRIS